MKKEVRQQNKSGFTIIEVMLVLALSGLLFVGLIAGFAGSLAKQRYKDATNDVVSQLRSLYSIVSNTQVQPRESSSACYGLQFDESGSMINISNGRANVNRGRSECVVYGIVAQINGGNMEITQIIGKDIHYVDGDVDSSSLTDLQLLKKLQGNNIVAMGDKNGLGCTPSLAGDLQNYSMKWGSSLKKTGTHDDLQASILIFRSPRNGSIHTYVWDDVVRVSEADGTPLNTAEAIKGLSCSETQAFKQYSINTYLDKFEENELRMCVDSGEGMLYDGNRRMIRVLKYGHSASAIELVNADDDMLVRDDC